MSTQQQQKKKYGPTKWGAPLWEAKAFVPKTDGTGSFYKVAVIKSMDSEDEEGKAQPRAYLLTARDDTTNSKVNIKLSYESACALIRVVHDAETVPLPDNWQAKEGNGEVVAPSAIKGPEDANEIAFALRDYSDSITIDEESDKNNFLVLTNLKSEDWSKVAKILSNYGGSYVTAAGGGPYFAVPRARQ